MHTGLYSQALIKNKRILHPRKGKAGKPVLNLIPYMVLWWPGAMPTLLWQQGTSKVSSVLHKLHLSGTPAVQGSIGSLVKKESVFITWSFMYQPSSCSNPSYYMQFPTWKLSFPHWTKRDIRILRAGREFPSWKCAEAGKVWHFHSGWLRNTKDPGLLTQAVQSQKAAAVESRGVCMK